MLRITAIALLFATTAFAEAPQVYSEGQRPDDARLQPPKDLNGYFPFTPAKSPEEWERRAEEVRRQVLVATGLWPKPEPAEIEPIVGPAVERDDYTVSPVRFESTPGLWVTGSLYRPKNANGKIPAILSPHGHWPQGRFHDHGEGKVKQEIAAGAERFEAGGRHPIQARCVQLARMGCLVFQYDMLGYADSAPISYQLAHRFARQRPEMSQPDRWGLFSPQSEHRLINVLGLQTLNSLRVLDWISSLPEVDTDRIGVTGASGGGTQTFILTAIDDRIDAAFPAVMVSTAMQGGCTCENATYLRVNTGNVEFAALTAPRPLGLTAANDWTREMPTKGLPELRRHYEMLGVPDRVRGEHFPFPHNYNAVSRQLMYEFFNDAFSVGFESPIEERDYEPLSVEEMTVWRDVPKPEATDEAEIAIVTGVDEANRQQLAALEPKDEESLEEYRRVVGGAVDVMLGRDRPAAEDVEFDKVSETPGDGFLHYAGKLRVKSQGEELPAVFLYPEVWKGGVAIWIDGRGKAGLYDEKGKPIAAVKQLLADGVAVASPDLFLTGEFTEDGSPVEAWPKVENSREAISYTLGYNHPLFAQRVHDVLATIAFVEHHEESPSAIHLVGVNGGGPIAIAACAQARDSIDKLAVDTAGFRFDSITDWRNPMLWPGAVKYGDLPGVLALCAPTPLWIAGEKSVPEIVEQAYAAAGAEEEVTRADLAEKRVGEAAAKWIAD